MRPYEYTSNGKYEAKVNPTYCKASVVSHGGWHHHQCQRKIWKDGWCKQHHPDTVAEREKANEKRRIAKDEASPFGRMMKAHKEIDRLKRLLRKHGCRELKCPARMRMLVAENGHCDE